MNIEGIDIKDIEFGEPIEKREGTFFDGYRYGLYKAHNIIDNQCKEIERLSKEVDMWNKKYNEQFDIINELEKCIVMKTNSDFIDTKVKDVCCELYQILQELKGDSSNE